MQVEVLSFVHRMKENEVTRLINDLEAVKHTTDGGTEYRSAREIQTLLGYTKRDNFVDVIGKAKKACERSTHLVSDHFPDVRKTIDMPKGAQKEIPDILLTRYACYLIAQNGDSRKDEIALAQTYFATQTRKQELQQRYLEDKKRIDIRKELSEHNKSLASTAKKSGVYQFGQFQDAGYQGLYGGLRAKDIKEKKWLDDKENMLDHMSSEELGANLFRATQTDAKLQRDLAAGKEIGQDQAEKTHYEVGQKVRATIQELGGTMPEQLPLTEHIKHSRDRLEDMATPFSGSLSTSPSLTYQLPHSAPWLQALVQILKANPWDQRVRIGSAYFKVSQAWLLLLEEFFLSQ
jgi:DNA-damage-inducible protein D